MQRTLSSSSRLTIVLIYPYWNVNLHCIYTRCVRLLSFNLSILECKWEICLNRCVNRHVLIYPYWNVNAHVSVLSASRNRRFNLSILECKCCAVRDVDRRAESFNLSILECKLIYLNHFKVCKHVLIYPYWNVNANDQQRAAVQARVLIYPYWNVNKQPRRWSAWSAAVLIYPYWNVNAQTSAMQAFRGGF